ncbi:hypothetical protein [Burkholderia pseudomallei]|uniref:hypothetical protein n=1 Tax=Burkholderia pseudomallei TaxID=28450 RepID=UPI003C7CCCA8
MERGRGRVDFRRDLRRASADRGDDALRRRAGKQGRRRRRGEGKSEGEGEAAFARSASCTGFTWAAPPAPGVRAGLSELAGYAARTASSAPGAAAPDAKAIADAHAASAPPAARVTAAMARVETMRRAFLAPGAPARAGPRAANAAPARRAAPLRLPPVTARRNRSCRT